MMGDTVAIHDIKYPEDGYGIFTYLDHYKYPYKGYPDERIVEKNAILKRCVLATIKRFGIYALPLILFLPGYFKRKAFEKFVFWISELYGTAFRPHFPAEKRLCPSGREINRVGELLIKDIKPEGRYRHYQDFLRTILLIWEFDNSYRYRGQDVFSELNKENLKKNPKEEIVRLFKIGLERERSGLSDKDKKFLDSLGVEHFDVSRKWKLVLRILGILLFFSRDFVRVAQKFLTELDLSQIKPDEGDWYWMCERCDYDFGGKTFTERLLFRLRQDEEYFKTLPPSPPPQAQIVMIPNDEFYYLQKPQAEQQVQNLLKQLWEGVEKKKKELGLL